MIETLYHEVAHSTNPYALEGMIEVEENNNKALRKIRVIIIEDFKKNKIFLSVMDKK